MSIPRALFSVGEEVLVVSNTISPGNLIELMVERRQFMRNEWCSSEGNRHPPGWRYIFPGELTAPEKRLRKKQIPGDSFDKLMQDLKRPAGVAQ